MGSRKPHFPLLKRGHGICERIGVFARHRTTPNTVETGHENGVRTCVHQVKSSHVRYLCGETCTFGGDGCERRLLERGSASVVGHDHAELELCKQRPPKRRVFVGFEAVHDADRARPAGAALRYAPNRLQQMLLDGDRVRCLAGAGVLSMSFDRVCSLGSGFWIIVARKLEVIRVTAFVSADKTPAIPKIGNGEKACVRAPRASGGEALDGQ